MPTTRPRHMLTETEELSAALTDAALMWPELAGDKGALLRKLIEAGAQSVKSGGSVKALIDDAAGAASGCYPRNARAELLSEWPA